MWQLRYLFFIIPCLIIKYEKIKVKITNFWMSRLQKYLNLQKYKGSKIKDPPPNMVGSPFLNGGAYFNFKWQKQALLLVCNKKNIARFTRGVGNSNLPLLHSFSERLLICLFDFLFLSFLSFWPIWLSFSNFIFSTTLPRYPHLFRTFYLPWNTATSNTDILPFLS